MEGYKLLSRTLALAAGTARADQLHRRVPRARAGGPAARRGEARRHPARPDQGDRRHLAAAATRSTTCSRSCSTRFNIQVEKIDLQHAHPAAHHRHHAQQGVAPVRRADAHRARGPRAAAAGTQRPEIPASPAALPAARRLLLRRRAGAAARRQGARQPRARRPRLRRPDRALPARHPGAGARPGDHAARSLDYLVGLLRSQKRMELHGIVYDGYLPCVRVLEARRGARAQADRLTGPIAFACTGGRPSPPHQRQKVPSRMRLLRCLAQANCVIYCLSA